MIIKEIKYYKLINDIKFTDGFFVKAGTTVMLNQSEGDWNNVQIEDENTKRIFWVQAKDMLFKHTKKERWNNDKINQHNIDIGEKFLENEQGKTNTSRTGTVKKKSVKKPRSHSKIKNTTGNRAKRGTTKPVKKGTKKITKKSGTKKKK